MCNVQTHEKKWENVHILSFVLYSFNEALHVFILFLNIKSPLTEEEENNNKNTNNTASFCCCCIPLCTLPMLFQDDASHPIKSQFAILRVFVVLYVFSHVSLFCSLQVFIHIHAWWSCTSQTFYIKFTYIWPISLFFFLFLSWFLVFQVWSCWKRRKKKSKRLGRFTSEFYSKSCLVTFFFVLLNLLINVLCLVCHGIIIIIIFLHARCAV